MAEELGLTAREEQERLREFFIKYFEAKALKIICSACGAIKWQPTQLLSVPVTDLEGEITDPIKVNRLAPLVCLECGYTVFFNAGYIAHLQGLDDDENIIEGVDNEKPS